MKGVLILAGTLVAVWASPSLGDEPSDVPKPVPATRPELKAALEALKERRPRILPPPKTEDQTGVDNGGAQANYLPESWGLGGFGQHSFSASGRTGQRIDHQLDELFTDACFWVVSRGNNCHYCLGHQELKLGFAGFDDGTIAALDSDWSRFDPRQQAALAYARRLTLEPHLVNDAEIAALRKLFSHAEIIELTYHVALFNSANRWTDGMGLPQERHFSDDGEITFTTPTNKQFQHAISIVTPTTRKARPPLAALEQIQQAMVTVRNRAPRVTLPPVDLTRRELAGIIGDRKPFEWERALAAVSAGGPAQVATLNTIMTDEHLPPRLKAEISLVTAAYNRAWYAVGHAMHRLRNVGVTPDEIAALLKPQSSPDASPAHRLAAKSTTDPHLITDADIARVRQHYSDAETAQIMHVVCMANMFDRFTQALGLPLEPTIAGEISSALK